MDSNPVFIHSNRTPQSVIMKKGTCLLKGTAISTDRNLMDKGAEKILKYTESK